LALAHRTRAQHVHPDAIHGDHGTWRAAGKPAILNYHFNFVAERGPRLAGLRSGRLAR
jgi:hypothetical protein